jgi:hypothetical protein
VVKSLKLGQGCFLFFQMITEEREQREKGEGAGMKGS